MGSCKEQIMEKRAGDRERERERLRARLRETHMEKEKRDEAPQEKGRDTEGKRQRSIKHTCSKQQGSLPEAA